MKLSLINAIGCVVLLGMAAMQWVKHEKLRNHILDQQKITHEIAVQRDEAQDKVTALQADIEDLKKAIEETQKAAEAASAVALQRENENKTLAEANGNLQIQNQSLTAERDALQASTVAWEKAVKERDAALIKLNAEYTALRTKLDQAIEQLKKAGAQ